MKTFSTFFAAVLFALGASAQNGIYLFGYMENAPEDPVSIETTIYSDPPISVSLETEPSGEIITQWVDLPSENWYGIEASFTDCDGYVSSVYWPDSAFQNLIDIPLYFEYCSGAGDDVYGCTDPFATNYDPSANVDDGSCQYTADCVPALVQLSGTSTVSGAYQLYQNDSLIQWGDYNGSELSFEACLYEGCYDLDFDIYNYSDTLSAVTYTVTLDNIQTIAGAFYAYYGGGTVNFEIGNGCDTTSNEIYGCTDPSAINYNPWATIDDGSCTYDTIPAENDLCADAQPIEPGTILINNSNATQNEGIWGECWGFGSGEGEQTSIWYTFTTPSTPASIHLEALYDGSNTLTDTQFGIFETCGGEMIYCDGNSGQGLMSAFDFECGELDVNTTYILMIDGWFGDAGTCYLNYSVDTACATEVLGCTDPQALNYNPDATIDDGSCEYAPCDANAVTVALSTASWAAEISWQLLQNDSLVASGSGYENDSSYQQNLCLEDGCYQFILEDSFGDGWNGAYYTIYVNDSVLVSGTLPSSDYALVNLGINQAGCNPEVYGCTDPQALNYNPDATIDDGSCEYTPCDANAVTVALSTADWAGEISWQLLQNDSLVASGSGYENDSSYQQNLCLEDGCYQFILEDSFGDGWNGAYYTIYVNDSVLVSGTLPSSDYALVNLGINQAGCNPEVYGCTDPEAVNYNPEATIDDGSCYYEVDCSISFELIPDSLGNILWVLPSQNILDATAVLWDFGDSTSSTAYFPEHTYEDEGPYTLCVTAWFDTQLGTTCTVSFCAEVSGTMVNGSGFGPTGFTINIINGEIPTGIDPVENESGRLHLYPNPANQNLNLRLDNATPGLSTLSIYDITGQKMLSEKISISDGQLFTLPVSQLSDGVYILQIENNERIHTARFVKAE